MKYKCVKYLWRFDLVSKHDVKILPGETLIQVGQGHSKTYTYEVTEEPEYYEFHICDTLLHLHFKPVEENNDGV